MSPVEAAALQGTLSVLQKRSAVQNCSVRNGRSVLDFGGGNAILNSNLAAKSVLVLLLLLGNSLRITLWSSRGTTSLTYVNFRHAVRTTADSILKNVTCSSHRCYSLFLS